MAKLYYARVAFAVVAQQVTSDLVTRLRGPWSTGTRRAVAALMADAADALFRYQNAGGEESHTIHFSAVDDEQAVRSVFRWAENRHHAMPDIFGRPLALKVCHFEPQPIDDDGSFKLPTGFHFYEWKCDTGERGRVRVGASASWFDGP